MYFPIRRSLPARPEPDNTFQDDSTIIRDGINSSFAFEQSVDPWTVPVSACRISSCKHFAFFLRFQTRK